MLTQLRLQKFYTLVTLYAREVIAVFDSSTNYHVVAVLPSSYCSFFSMFLKPVLVADV
jgi:hypothetical protein